MMKRMIFAAFLTACGATNGKASGPALPHAAPPATFVPSKEAFEARARVFMNALSAHDYVKAEIDFGDRMKDELGPEKLGAVWEGLEKRSEGFVGLGEFKFLRSDGAVSVLVSCEFKKAEFLASVNFSEDGKIEGFFIKPAEVNIPWDPPAYADQSAFVESPISVGTAPALPGTLSLPKGAGPFPIAILVHGSGPNGQDEQLGSLKVFKDLAWGLASRGVAVIRYVKRTKHSPKGVVTEKEEVIDGAIAAIALARTLPSIDPKRVIVVGHSQGANLAPRIVRESDGAALGFVSLAGSTRAFQDIVLDQANFFARLYPGKEMDAKVEESKAFKQQLDSPSLNATDDVRVPFAGSIPGAYFLAMRGYHPEEVAASLPGHALILQGERDYQVTKADYSGWQKALSRKPRVTFKLYPDLNHAFAKGEGPPDNREYEKPGQHVDVRVVDDIASWIKTLPRK